MTGLLKAVENGDLATVRSLLGSGVKPDDDAFYHACEQSNVELLGLLYRPGYERLVNHTSWTSRIPLACSGSWITTWSSP